jgi:hypothetical protein
MGAREKYIKKHGIAPSDEELAAFEAKLQRKKEKKQAAAAAAAAASSGAPAAPPAEPAPQPPPAKKRKRADAADTSGRADEFATALATASRAVAAAATKLPKASKLSEGEFEPIWEQMRARAEELLAAAAEAYADIPEERLAPAARDALLDELRRTLALACEPAAAVLAACRKGKPPPAAGKKAGGRPVLVKHDVLNAGLVKLRAFDFDVFEAVSGTVKDGSLSVDELKQLAYHKVGVSPRGRAARAPALVPAVPRALTAPRAAIAGRLRQDHGRQQDEARQGAHGGQFRRRAGRLTVEETRNSAAEQRALAVAMCIEFSVSPGVSRGRGCRAWSTSGLFYHADHCVPSRSPRSVRAPGVHTAAGA